MDVSRFAGVIGLLLWLLLSSGCSGPRLAHPADGAPARTPEGVLVAETTIKRDGQSQVAKLFLAKEKLILQVDGGYAQVLENPAGLAGRTQLTPVAYGNTTHLLVTVADDRITWGWVLIPTNSGLSISLRAQVDEGISVLDDAIKVSTRKYLEGGGYKVVSNLYRFNPSSGQYVTGE